MKPSTALNTHRVAIREIVHAHRASNARVFGSVLHAQDIEGSDLDILVEPQQDIATRVRSRIVANSAII